MGGAERLGLRGPGEGGGTQESSPNVILYASRKPPVLLATSSGVFQQLSWCLWRK